MLRSEQIQHTREYFRRLLRHQETEFNTKISYLTVGTEFRNHWRIEAAGHKRRGALLTKQEYIYKFGKTLHVKATNAANLKPTDFHYYSSSVGKLIK